MSVPLIIAAVAGIILLYVWVTYNGLAAAKLRISEALSHIDVQLKRRTDLIPNLIETVKGYAKHEKELLENITKARTSMMAARTTEAKAAASNQISEALKTLFAVTENYPDLKANENFLQLQQELKDTEDKIAYSRQFYNSNVLDYNTKIATFPSGFIAQIFNFKAADFFAATEEERKNIKVSF